MSQAKRLRRVRARRLTDPAFRQKELEANRHRRKLSAPTRSCPTRCECCGRKPAGFFQSLVLDHDHKTGLFRGWLCNRCNLAIGLLGDRIENVRKAVEYLRKSLKLKKK